MFSCALLLATGACCAVRPYHLALLRRPESLARCSLGIIDDLYLCVQSGLVPLHLKSLNSQQTVIRLGLGNQI